MGAAEKIETTRSSKWTSHKGLFMHAGITLDQAKKYRYRGLWLEGKHWIKNPVGAIVYNLKAIDDWQEGKM